jgi:hypothetical protein
MDSNFSNVTKMSLTRKQKLLSGAEFSSCSVLQSFHPASSLWGILERLTAQALPDRLCACGSFSGTSRRCINCGKLRPRATEFAGNWGGSALVKGRGTCRFGLEIGTQQNPDKPFTAYTNMLCVDMTLPPGGQDER